MLPELLVVQLVSAAVRSDSFALASYRRVHGDLNEIGEVCGKNRVGRIMQLNRIKAVRGYKAPRRIAGRAGCIWRWLSISSPVTWSAGR